MRASSTYGVEGGYSHSLIASASPARSAATGIAEQSPASLGNGRASSSHICPGRPAGVVLCERPNTIHGSTYTRNRCPSQGRKRQNWRFLGKPPAQSPGQFFASTGLTSLSAIHCRGGRGCTAVVRNEPVSASPFQATKFCLLSLEKPVFCCPFGPMSGGDRRRRKIASCRGL